MFLIIVWRGLGGVREFGAAAPINSFLFSYVYHNSNAMLGSISAALSCLVWSLPSGRSASSSPEQRLVIEPNAMYVKYSHESVFWELPHVKPSYSCAHDLSVPFLLFTSSGTQIALYSQEV